MSGSLENRNQKRKNAVKHKIVLFYCFAFALSWASWLLMFSVYQNSDTIDLITLFFSTIGCLGPLISLVIIEKLSRKEIEVEKILSTIKIRGLDRGWLLSAIFALPVMTLLGNLFYSIIGWQGKLSLMKPGFEDIGMFVLPVIVVHFVASLITSPLFEEPGWRGFALRRLQERFGREVGSIIVGVLWWVWHQPMNITFGIQPTVYSFLSMVFFSFMIDSLFNLSGKNLFMAMLAHQSAGTMNIFVYESHENVLTLTLLISFVILLRYRESKGKLP